MKVFPKRDLKITIFTTGNIIITGSSNTKDTLAAYKKALPAIQRVAVRGKDDEEELAKRAQFLRNEGKEPKSTKRVKISSDDEEDEEQVIDL
jgi:hypothetical protein